MTVAINAEKPRKGAFVVSKQGSSKPLLELLNMARPFTKLKALDMDEEIEKILKAFA